MAKKKPTSRAEAVRQAVDQAFQAPQIPRERISELLDELGQTAGRLRGAVEDLRPASTEDTKSLRADLEALTKRVEVLEAQAKAKPKPAARRTAAKPAARTAAAKSSRTGAKPGASAKTTAPAKPAAKPRRSTAAKPKPAAEGS